VLHQIETTTFIFAFLGLGDSHHFLHNRFSGPIDIPGIESLEDTHNIAAKTGPCVTGLDIEL